MNLQRKIYATRSQKVGDFFLGIGLFIAINIVFSMVMSFGLGLVSMLFSSVSPDGSAGMSAFSGFLMTVIYLLPLVVQIVALIYFALTRYWIALGMLGTFAIGLLFVLLLTAACFGIAFLFSGAR